MTDRMTDRAGLKVAATLADFIEHEVAEPAWLARLGSAAPSRLDYEAGVEAALDALAAHLAAHLDLEGLLGLARPPAG